MLKGPDLLTFGGAVSAGVSVWGPAGPSCPLARPRAPAAAKARGVKLGNPKLAEARVAGQAVRTANADQRAAAVLPVIEAVKASGAVALRDIATALNAHGITTARGGKWTATAVSG